MPAPAANRRAKQESVFFVGFSSCIASLIAWIIPIYTALSQRRCNLLSATLASVVHQDGAVACWAAAPVQSRTVDGDVVAVCPRNGLSRRRHDVLRLILELDRPPAAFHHLVGDAAPDSAPLSPMRRAKRACVSLSAIPFRGSAQPSRVTLMLMVNSHLVAGLLRVEGTDGLSFFEATSQWLTLPLSGRQGVWYASRELVEACPLA